MESIKLFLEFINENMSEERFIVNKNKFQLYLGDNLIAESGYDIIQPDEWFNEKYVILHNLKTNKNFQRKGFAKSLLEHIFNYVKNELKLNIISLVVYKDNDKAVNLYFKCGFEIYIEYDNSYSLIKKL